MGALQNFASANLVLNFCNLCLVDGVRNFCSTVQFLRNFCSIGRWTEGIDQ